MRKLKGEGKVIVKVTVTASMQHVLDMMGRGWELGLSTAIDTHWWLQKGGSGKGGPMERVNAKTADGLVDRGLIRVNKNGFPLRTYRLATPTEVIDRRFGIHRNA